MPNPKVYAMSMPIYVKAPPPGVLVPHIIPPPVTSPGPGYFWGYPVPQTATVMQTPGPDGTYGWPIYFKGGTSSNPQFAYYPVSPSAAPLGAVPVGGIPPGAAFPGTVPQGASGKKYHQHRSKESSDDDSEKCACYECAHGKSTGKAGKAGNAGTSGLPPDPPLPHLHHLGHFIPAQFYGPPPATTTQQTTTFIPYVVPTGCPTHHCNSKTTGSTGTHSTDHGDKHHGKKPSSSSYHYAESCNCNTCKARRMEIEMERIQEERKNEREYKDTQEFIKMKKRVDREERGAKMEDMYRAKKAGGKNVTFDEHRMCNHMCFELEGDYEWVAVPAGPVPITAFHLGGTTPITLRPLHTGPYMSGLEEENARLRHEKGHLKDKIKRERSMRNHDDAARAFLSTRLHELDKDIQKLKKKACKAQGGAGTKAPTVEIQFPLVGEKHHPKNSASEDKGKGKEGGGAKDFGDHGKTKAKNVESKHKHPHVCYDSECPDFDSCSECSFECDIKGCRTCRPRGGRR
ncbi:uncharacterized protein DFL_003173 [Arthrobotrys flagrans]|uniref:Uncharacterized protein n=1 Tax=Arthrobotrys flagrans TaxID=97331 RepID=A0A437A188_ARTFL|nr:hypothetical protein DFL_003173 [Arthrobotrys flagrans]